MLPLPPFVPPSLTPPNCPPSISPLLYTYIHLPTTFFPLPMPPFTLYTSPAPLPPIFRFFWFIFSHSPATSTLLHNYTSIPFVLQGFISLSWSTLLPYPCLPPLPPFSLFWTIYGHFFASVPFYLHIYIHDILHWITGIWPLLGVLSAARAEGLDCQFIQEQAAQKASKNLHISSNAYSTYLPWKIWGREALW